jgi:hypothetical protein
MLYAHEANAELIHSCASARNIDDDGGDDDDGQTCANLLQLTTLTRSRRQLTNNHH